MKSSLTGFLFFQEYDRRVSLGTLSGGGGGRLLGSFSWQETFLLMDLLLVRDVNHLLVTGGDWFLPAANQPLSLLSPETDLTCTLSTQHTYSQTAACGRTWSFSLSAPR